jgi:hypothetical protein
MCARPDNADRIRPGFSFRWLGLGLLLLAGCGLADYEAKMAESQKRLERIEKENKVLDRPLMMPTREEEGLSVSVGNIFVRPPRGIKEIADPNPRNVVFYVYGPRPEGASVHFSKMELAFAPEGKEEKFSEWVFGDFQGRGEVRRTQRQVQVSGKQVNFDVGEVNLGQFGFISINVPRGCSRPVALIYYLLPNAKPVEFQPVIQISLETFGCDGDVAKQMDAYQKGLRWSGLR